VLPTDDREVLTNTVHDLLGLAERLSEFTAFIREAVAPVAAAREVYADSLQVGFLAYHRTDGDLIDTTGAVKHIKHA
jgi:hypothetical protein